jgi:5-enolpyruvylshikimate-3-phosphate synthase
MEPQYMILGQAAGVAAKLAIAGSTTVQQIPVSRLLETLKQRGAVTEYGQSPQAAAIQILNSLPKAKQ